MSIRHKQLRRFRRKFQAEYGVAEYRKRVARIGFYHDIYGKPILWEDLMLMKFLKPIDEILTKQYGVIFTAHEND